MSGKTHFSPSPELSYAENSVVRMRDAGIEVTMEIPDFNGIPEALQTFRAILLGTMMGPLLEKHRSQIAPEIVDNY